ncbi:MAG: hypothetical protein WC292_00230 [Clostridia bacterium]
MKYAASRTSGFGISEPCRGAFEEESIGPDHWGNDYTYTDWFIEINTLEELNAFIAEHKRIVIEPHQRIKDCLKIEIYDDYREDHYREDEYGE